MSISFSKKLLKVILLILFLKDISPLNFSFYSDGVKVLSSQSNFFSKNNSINLNINNIKSVLEILHKYDLKNSPKMVINNDGSTTFFYRRSEDEPEKNIREIKKLIEKPPSMERYQNFIRKALTLLVFNDILVQIKDLNNED